MARAGERHLSGMLAVEEALARVLASVSAPLAEERVALEAAYGRVLSSPIAALRTQPPFPNSAMDGYALRASDTKTPPATLTVVGESAAGRGLANAIGPGQAVRIFTGAPMPEGADAIVVQEDVKRDGDRIVLAAESPPGDNLRAAGLDFREGEALLPAGRRLTPRDVALAAAANHATLPVRRAPRVAILATGDELVQPGETPGPAQIVASNNFAVAGLVAACGGVPFDLGIARDDATEIEQAIGRARDGRAEVLVTLGGASVGDYDLVQKTLVGLGMELGFWRIAMRPGKPLMHGRLGELLALGLPGNPTSSIVCAILFLRPLLRALLGEPEPGADPSRMARLGIDLGSNGVRQDYMRATFGAGPDGVPVVTPIPHQDSSLVKAMARADGLIVRSPHAPPAKAGATCRAIAFDGLGI